MSFNTRLINDKDYVRKFARLQQIEHVTMQVCLRNLNANIQHPYIIEGEFAVISSEYIQLPLDDISGVSAARSRPKVTRLHLLPIILLNVKYVHIIHPVCSIIPTEVVNLGVDEAACCRDSGARLLTSDHRFDPCKRCCIKVEDVVELSVLIWFTAKNVDLFLKSDGRVLQAAYRSNSLGSNWPGPLKCSQIENE